MGIHKSHNTKNHVKKYQNFGQQKKGEEKKKGEMSFVMIRATIFHTENVRLAFSTNTSRGSRIELRLLKDVIDWISCLEDNAIRKKENKKRKKNSSVSKSCQKTHGIKEEKRNPFSRLQHALANTQFPLPPYIQSDPLYTTTTICRKKRTEKRRKRYDILFDREIENLRESILQSGGEKEGAKTRSTSF